MSKWTYGYSSKTNTFSISSASLANMLRRASMTKEACVTEDDTENARRLADQRHNKSREEA